MKNLDQFYMRIAIQVSKASYCERSKVGAILIKEGNIISFGYNGTPRGFDNKCELDGITKREVLHAESNAITKCAKVGGQALDSSLYVTVSPCYDCSKLIIQSGIKAVYFLEHYRDTKGLALLKQANIYFEKIIL